MASVEGLQKIVGEAVSKHVVKADTKPGKVRIKKAPPKARSESDNNIEAGSSLINQLDKTLRSTFEVGRPFDDKLNPIQCKHCKRPLLQQFANEHITVCINKKNEKAQRKKEQKEEKRKAREAQQKAERAGEEAGDGEGDEDSLNGDGRIGKKSAIKGKAGTSKKRKADDEADKGVVKKKTKKELEAMKPKGKPRGPVNVDIQCGVLLPNGQMCARSLTCKSHSMGAKRAVPGRSMPYNFLLQQYNKKNQVKQQKAAMDASALPEDDDEENAGPIDSDEEKDLVMAGIARSRPQPIAQYVPISLRRKYQFVRVQNMIMSALGGGRSFLGTTTDGDDAENQRASVSQSTAPRPSISGSIGGPSRKPSMVVPGTPIAAN